jgi:hypothetical protein
MELCGIPLRKTRFGDENGDIYYFQRADGKWQHVHHDKPDGKPAQVGPAYATKAELLADSTRYCESWGY